MYIVVHSKVYIEYKYIDSTLLALKYHILIKKKKAPSLKLTKFLI